MRHTLYSIFVFLVVSNTQAQDTARHFLKKKIISKIEIITGFARMENRGYYETSMQPNYGYSFGAGVGHIFSKRFDLKAKVAYELKGCLINRHATSPPAIMPPVDHVRTTTTKNRYLTLSATPTFRLFRKRRIAIGIGAFYSFLKKTKVTISIHDNITGSTTTEVHTDPRNFLSRQDFGVSGSVGYIFPIAHKKELTVSLAWNKSLTDFEDYFSQYFRYNVILLSASFTFYR